MKKYPVLDQVLADVPARKAGVPIPKDSKGLTPTVKKAIIKELYAAIGERIFHWDSSQIQWMHNIIDKFMSARDVEREWEFIQKGHVEQLPQVHHVPKNLPGSIIPSGGGEAAVGPAREAGYPFLLHAR